MKDIQKELSRAKILMLSKKGAVFFSTVCLSLETIVTDSIPTAATNGKYIKYNPDFFLSLTDEERVFVLAHETLHVIFLHMTRRGDRNPRLWNVAGDYVINNILKEQGYRLIEGVKYNPAYADMTTEEVYKHLLEEGEDQKPDFDDIEEIDFYGDVAAQEKFDDEIESTIIRARLLAEMSGEGENSPALQRFLSELLRPKLNWKAILKKYVTATVCRSDYSWKKPKQRGDTFIPRLRSQQVGQIDIAIDTSGSISDTEFNQFLSEVYGVLKSVKPSSIGLIQWDHELRANDPVKSVQDLTRLPFTGGGGTCVSAAFKGFADNKTSQLLVIITDGYFFPEDPVKEIRPVLWIVHNNPGFSPPWGRKDKVIHYSI
ncbi:VWA-like domain-containing protein [Acinetobacter baumannii]|nr:VWA-like domain-containing protein [Acinetobacter baumannii]